MDALVHLSRVSKQSQGRAQAGKCESFPHEVGWNQGELRLETQDGEDGKRKENSDNNEVIDDIGPNEKENEEDRGLMMPVKKERDTGKKKVEQELPEGKHYHSCTSCSCLSCYQSQAPGHCGKGKDKIPGSSPG